MSSRSALPKQVREAAARAEAILDEVNGKKPEGADPNADPNAQPNADPNAAAPPADPNAAPPADPSAAPPADPPKDPAPPQDPPSDPNAAPNAEDGWEHRYKVLQGKYNAEVPRLQKKLGAAEDTIDELRQRQNNLETMLATIQSKSKEPAKPADPPKPTITDEEIETYGPDLVDLIRRAAREEAERMVAAGEARLSDKIGKVEKSTSQVSQSMALSAQQRTIQALEAEVPNWLELNHDEDGFIPWLDQVDPFAGKKRGVLLREAFNANDAPRVIAFFKGYLNENAAVTPEPSTPAPADPPADPPANPQEPQTPMDKLVAPGAPKAPTAGAPNEAGKRVWTRKEVARLYQEKNEFIRRYPGRDLPEELQKQERDLFKAQSEGRLR